MNEAAMYYQIAEVDLIATAHECYGRTGKAVSCAAECAYIKLHNALPEWGVVVEGFEVVNGSYIFIHRDPDAIDD